MLVLLMSLNLRGNENVMGDTKLFGTKVILILWSFLFYFSRLLVSGMENDEYFMGEKLFRLIKSNDLIGNWATIVKC